MGQSLPKETGTPALLASRRPVFDRLMRVWAYELRLITPSGQPLSWIEAIRSGSGSEEEDNELFLSLTGNKRALIKMSPGELLSGAAQRMPDNWLVWVQADPSEPNPRLADALRAAHEAGREVILRSELIDLDPSLAGLVDIVVDDFQNMSRKEPQEQGPESSGLVVHVDTPEQFKQAKELGYRYFRGQFYARPRVMEKDRPLPGFRLNQLRLLQEIHSPEIRFRRLEEIVSGDVSLAYDLLRYINSPYFSLRVTVNSIKQALSLLGEVEVKKWISVVVLNKAAEGKPHELVVLSLVRALFFSETGALAGLDQRSDDLFLAGLFSLLDAFFDQPLALILKKMPLAQDIVAALLGSRSPLSGVVDLALAYEANDWPEVNQAAIELDLDSKNMLRGYHRAVTGAREFFREEKG